MQMCVGKKGPTHHTKRTRTVQSHARISELLSSVANQNTASLLPVVALGARYNIALE